MSFDDIAGCDYAKEIIKETFILPNIVPHIFKGNARPWQSILIYGVTNFHNFNFIQPPGVGKTMMAQALANEIKATVFWVSMADITSKFIANLSHY